MNAFIIDVETSLPVLAPPPGRQWSPAGRHLSLVRALSALKTTVACVDAGRYHHELSSAQVHLVTTWSPEKLDAWLDSNKAASEVIGWVQRQELIKEYVHE